MARASSVRAKIAPRTGCTQGIYQSTINYFFSRNL